MHNREMHSAPPDLPTLRAELDRIDHALLELLSERVALLRELHRYKVTHNLPLQDSTREAHLLEERAAHGKALGVDPGVVRSMFRAILDASLDQLERFSRG